MQKQFIILIAVLVVAVCIPFEKTQSQVAEQDSLALLPIYNALDGDNHFTGSVPDALLKLTQLMELLLDNNQLPGFPDLSHNQFIHEPAFSNQQNYLHFVVLENIVEQNFILTSAEQRPINALEDIPSENGNTLQIRIDLRGKIRQYLGYKDGELIAETEELLLLIKNAEPAHSFCGMWRPFMNPFRIAC